MSPAPTRARARERVLIALTAVLVLGLACASAGSGAATSESTVVTAEVLSATNLDVDTGCGSGVADITDFGQLMPDTDNVTGLDCSVVFGSSNDTAMLRAYQSDRVGTALVGSPDGAPDTGFGSGGYITHDFGGNNGFGWQGGGAPEQTGGGRAFVQDDGKILATGYSGGDMLVARFNPDGSLDTAGFNSPNGYRIINMGVANEGAAAVTVAADGDILVAGDSNCQIGIIRLTPSGGFDFSFNGTGWRRYDVAGSTCDSPTAIGEQPSGRILVMGEGSSNNGMVVGFTPTGGIDTSFSAPDGISLGEISTDYWQSYGMDDAGRVMVVASGICGCDAAISRADVDFTGPDFSFNGTGWVSIPRAFAEAGVTNFVARDVFADSQGRVVATLMSNSGGWEHVTMVRTTVGGALDPAFAGDGVANIDVGSAVGVQHGFQDAAGRYVVMLDWDGAFGGVGFARFTASGLADTSVQGLGFAWSTAPGNNYGAAIVPVPADGGYMVLGSRDVGAPDARLWKFGAAGVVPDYSDDVGDLSGDDWGTPGAAFFGACLIGSANAAANLTTWSEDVNAGADCADGDADPWEAIAQTSAGGSAKVLESDAAGQVAAQADIRFGFRVAADTAPGVFAAPITFEAVAPNL